MTFIDTILYLIIILSCIMILPASVYLIFIIYQGSNYEDKRQNSWRMLAHRHNFAIADNTSKLTGTYCGRQIVLQYEDSVTKMSVSEHLNPTSLTSESRNQTSQKDDLAPMYLTTTLKKLKGRIEISANGQEISYFEADAIVNTEYLQQILDVLNVILDSYPTVIEQGGKLAPTLEAIARKSRHALNDVAIQLLIDIGQETTLRLSDKVDELICRHCLVNCTPHTVKISKLKSITYFGCRTCGQSNDLISARIIAVLDNRMMEKQELCNGRLRVNWLKHRKLLDFEEVEIKHATAEEVERFVVHIRNDTFKSSTYYKKVNCILSSGCKLPSDTIHLLHNTFIVHASNQIAVIKPATTPATNIQFPQNVSHVNDQKTTKHKQKHIPALLRSALIGNSYITIGLIVLIFLLDSLMAQMREGWDNLPGPILLFCISSVFLFAGIMIINKAPLTSKIEALKSLSFRWLVPVSLYLLYFCITTIVAFYLTFKYHSQTGIEIVLLGVSLFPLGLLLLVDELTNPQVRSQRDDHQFALLPMLLGIGALCIFLGYLVYN